MLGERLPIAVQQRHILPLEQPGHRLAQRIEGAGVPLIGRRCPKGFEVGTQHRLQPAHRFRIDRIISPPEEEVKVYRAVCLDKAGILPRRPVQTQPLEIHGLNPVVPLILLLGPLQGGLPVGIILLHAQFLKIQRAGLQAVGHRLGALDVLGHQVPLAVLHGDLVAVYIGLRLAPAIGFVDDLVVAVASIFLPLVCRFQAGVRALDEAVFPGGRVHIPEAGLQRLLELVVVLLHRQLKLVGAVDMLGGLGTVRVGHLAVKAKHRTVLVFLIPGLGLRLEGGFSLVQSGHLRLLQLKFFALQGFARLAGHRVNKVARGVGPVNRQIHILGFFLHVKRPARQGHLFRQIHRLPLDDSPHHVVSGSDPLLQQLGGHLFGHLGITGHHHIAAGGVGPRHLHTQIAGRHRTPGAIPVGLGAVDFVVLPLNLGGQGFVGLLGYRVHKLACGRALRNRPIHRRIVGIDLLLELVQRELLPANVQIGPINRLRRGLGLGRQGHGERQVDRLAPHHLLDHPVPLGAGHRHPGLRQGLVQVF